MAVRRVAGCALLIACSKATGCGPALEAQVLMPDAQRSTLNARHPATGNRQPATGNRQPATDA